MPRKEPFGRKAAPVEYCPGFVDTNGIWNNGFPCPKNAKKYGPDAKYCCGTERKRFCCPHDDSKHQDDNDLHKSVVLLVGLVIGFAVLIVVLVIFLCYRCHCCILHKRRKHQQHQAINGYSYSCRQELPHVINRTTADGHTLTYTVCHQQNSYQAYLDQPLDIFPPDDPPPYPETLLVAKETQTGSVELELVDCVSEAETYAQQIVARARETHGTHDSLHALDYPSTSRTRPVLSTFRNPAVDLETQQQQHVTVESPDNEFLLAQSCERIPESLI